MVEVGVAGNAVWHATAPRYQQPELCTKIEEEIRQSIISKSTRPREFQSFLEK